MNSQGRIEPAADWENLVLREAQTQILQELAAVLNTNLDGPKNWVLWPENKRLAVAEILTRANLGMIIGNLELAFVDREIRYKTSIDVEGDRKSFL